MDWLLGVPQLQNTGSQIGVQVGNTYRVQETCLGEFKPILFLYCHPVLKNEKIAVLIWHTVKI